jgi:plastocyanin
MALAAIVLLLTGCGSTTGPAGTKSSFGGLPVQRFAAHYVDAAPVHGNTFTLVPDKVLINFDFSLAEPSLITVTKDGKTLQIGKTTISGPNSLHLSSTLSKDAGDGLFVVNYNACWPDKSCNTGQFAFTVNSKAKSAYIDMTGKSDVMVDMKDLRFQPARIAVSRGTRVTWVNKEAAVHFVNTDPHPSHNNLPDLNSLDLTEGQTYSYTFNQAGEWAYHCSAHFPQGMAGSIIVQ